MFFGDSFGVGISSAISSAVGALSGNSVFAKRSVKGPHSRRNVDSDTQEILNGHLQ